MANEANEVEMARQALAQAEEANDTAVCAREAALAARLRAATCGEREAEQTVLQAEVARCSAEAAQAAAELAEAERWLALAEHEARLVPGTRVRVVSRTERPQHRFHGTVGRIVGRDGGRVWEVAADDGQRILVDSRDLELVNASLAVDPCPMAHSG